jgi:hypothetical protein
MKTQRGERGMKKLLALSFLLLVPAPFAAQTLNSTGLDEMKKLEFLVGNWQGEGWMEFGPGQRRKASVTESVQSKLGGRVLIIEGVGKAKLPNRDEEVVVHSAFAFLYYDQATKRYAMRAFLANGNAVDAETNYQDGVFEWGLQIPQGKVRYKIKLNDQGQWFEVGEISQDGKTFRQFFEMTLNRVK